MGHGEDSTTREKGYGSVTTIAPILANGTCNCPPPPTFPRMNPIPQPPQMQFQHQFTPHPPLPPDPTIHPYRFTIPQILPTNNHPPLPFTAPPAPNNPITQFTVPNPPNPYTSCYFPFQFLLHPNPTRSSSQAGFPTLRQRARPVLDYLCHQLFPDVCC